MSPFFFRVTGTRSEQVSKVSLFDRYGVFMHLYLTISCYRTGYTGLH